MSLITTPKGPVWVSAPTALFTDEPGGHVIGHCKKGQVLIATGQGDCLWAEVKLPGHYWTAWMFTTDISDTEVKPSPWWQRLRDALEGRS